MALEVEYKFLVADASWRDDAEDGVRMRQGYLANRDRLSIWFGGIQVAKDGKIAEGYDEADAATHMRGENVTISVELGLGSGSATVFTCDLTAQYIAINADYRS